MDKLDEQSDSNGALRASKRDWECPCHWLVSVCIMLGTEITVDVQAYQDDVLVTNVPVKQQLSQSVSQFCDTVISQLRMSGAIFLVFLNPSPERAPERVIRRATCAGGVPRKLKPGAKRIRSCESEMTNFLQHLRRYCRSSISETRSGRSKRFRTRGSSRKQAGANGGDSETSRSSTYETSTSIDKFQHTRSYVADDEVHIPSLSSLLRDDATSAVLSIQDLPQLHCRSLEEEHPVSAKKRRADSVPILTDWNSLPYDIQDNIFQRLDSFKDLFQCKAVSKAWKQHIESEEFFHRRGSATSREGSFTAISYYIKNNAWQCTGYDLHSQTWRQLPTLSSLPAPDAELFKQYSVSGHGGLMCAVVSKGEVIVFNPLNGKRIALPPLLHPRDPVLVHIAVNSAAKSYKVIVAGSSTASDRYLSRKVEVFDSNTSKWTEASDVPGPVFGLNEHQAGVFVDGVLYFVAFLDGDCGRGVVALDVESETCTVACAIPFSFYSNALQLVECNGNVYLFSEQERGGSVEHCIDVLAGSTRSYRWGNVVRVKQSGGRGLQVYPEHTCVSFGDGKLCVFNTLSRDGVVYDVRDGKQVEVLQPPPEDQTGDKFFTLNPATFTLQPCFDTNC